MAKLDSHLVKVNNFKLQTMKIQLIQGQFTATDALDLISKMIDAKIKFHESRITSNCTEEDIKMRERKIKNLQKDLYEARTYIDTKQFVTLESDIYFDN